MCWFLFVMPSGSFADSDRDEPGPGGLQLNADVLVNDGVATGTAGEFAIRGQLFLDAVSARAAAQHEHAAERLRIAESLTLIPSNAPVEPFADARTALFQVYSPRNVSTDGLQSDDTPSWFAYAAVWGVPVMLVAGVWFGRVWTARKRVTV